MRRVLQPGNRIGWASGMASLLLVGSILCLGYIPGQSDFPLIISSYAIAFSAYIWICRSLVFASASEFSGFKFYFGLAIFLRFLLIFSFPNLSDDAYRFIWDGRAIVAGIHPFEHVPSWFMEVENQVPGLDQQLYEKLNSQDKFTVYPPVAQGVFSLACWLFPTSIYGSVLVMKVCLFLFEAGTIFLLPTVLKKLNLPSENALLYLLNPLIIIEVIGNLHFEGAMIFFLLLAFYGLFSGKLFSSTLTMALSIASKLLPLLFLPYLLKRLGWKKSVKYFLALSVFLILVFYPLFSEFFFSNMADSLDLYFRKFEFNASFYYVLRWLGYQWKGYNLIAWIGPLLAVVVSIFIIITALLEKKPDWKSLPLICLAAVTAYLLCGTTIHPWYVALPVFFCVFTPFRYPIVWSGLIFLTYINYSYTPYSENLILVALEYVVVIAVAAYEFIRFWSLFSFHFFGLSANRKL